MDSAEAEIALRIKVEGERNSWKREAERLTHRNKVLAAACDNRADRVSYMATHNTTYIDEVKVVRDI